MEHCCLIDLPPLDPSQQPAGLDRRCRRRRVEDKEKLNY
jgi:hypothetical protein